MIPICSNSTGPSLLFTNAPLKIEPPCKVAFLITSVSMLHDTFGRFSLIAPHANTLGLPFGSSAACTHHQQTRSATTPAQTNHYIKPVPTLTSLFSKNIVIQLTPITNKKEMDAPPTPRSLSPEPEEESDIELNYDAPATAAPEDAFFKDFKRSHISSSIHHLGVILNSRRKAAQEPIRGGTTAWIDHDDSGDYDPEAKTPKLSARRGNRVRVAASNGEPKSGNKFRRAGYCCLLMFSFESKEALEYLRRITPGPDVSEADNDDELSDSESDDDSDQGRRRLRRKIKQPKRLGAVAERYVDLPKSFLVC